MNANTLLSFLALIALGALFYGPWQSICTDIARQIVFEQRDNLFDMARAGRIEFDSDEYREIRVGLEGLIRFSHDLTFPKAICLLRVVPEVRERNREDPVVAAVLRLDDAHLQKDIMHLVVRSYISVIAMMVMKSMIGIIVMCVIAIPGIVVSPLLKVLTKNVLRWLKTYVFKFGRLIQAEAECA